MCSKFSLSLSFFQDCSAFSFSQQTVALIKRDLTNKLSIDFILVVIVHTSTRLFIQFDSLSGDESLKHTRKHGMLHLVTSGRPA